CTGNVHAIHHYRTGVHGCQAADHRQQRRLARPVRTYDGGETALGNAQADIIHHQGIAVALGYAPGFNHCLTPRNNSAMNNRPPANSMTSASGRVEASNCSSSTWPPTRQMMPASTLAGSVHRWRWVPVIQ